MGNSDFISEISMASVQRAGVEIEPSSKFGLRKRILAWVSYSG